MYRHNSKIISEISSDAGYLYYEIPYIKIRTEIVKLLWLW